MLIFILLVFSLQSVLPEEQPVQPYQPMVVMKPPMNMQPSNRPSVNLSDYFYPFNVTIRHLSPRSIEVRWSCKDNALTDRYEVTIKPVLASYKVVETVPNNMCYLLMDKLEPDTTYQIAVASIAGRNRKRSGYVIFRTYMEDDYTEFTEDSGGDYPPVYDGSSYSDLSSSSSSSSTDNAKGGLRFPRVRLVEIGLVLMALILWGCAIILFFHRWGKIRMLLPYQPDYKEMKNTTASCTTCSMTPHHQCQKIHHIQNPTSSAECYQAQPTSVGVGAIGITATYHPSPRTHHHHLPHQPMSEPGPSCSSFLIGGHNNVNVVTVAEAGCSPIRCNKIAHNEGDISIDMGLHPHFHPNRRARSAEQLKQYVFPWDEPSELECTEF